MKKESIIYLVLGLFARWLVALLRPLGILWAIIRIVFSKKLGWKELRQYCENIAVTEDQSGNVYMSFMFNDIMINKYSFNFFGDPDETLSSVYGKNYTTGKLTKFGKFWQILLDWIDTNHVTKSIESDEGKKSTGNNR